MNLELAFFFSNPEDNQLLCAERESYNTQERHVQNKAPMPDGISAGLEGSL